MRKSDMIDRELRNTVIQAAEKYYEFKHKNEKDFVPGNKIPYGGRVFDEKEITNLVESALDFWLTTGKFVNEFEDKFAKYIGVKYCSLTNSGSSANLLAFMALTASELGDKRIKQGDEVITVAAGFPTTVTPVIQFGAVPVFVDVTLPTYNIDTTVLENALSEKTKAVMVAHTLGNPFDMEKVMKFCIDNNLWLIEDNCDALGSSFYYNGEWRKTGSIGHIGTSSFYPPHHITMGEGGAVYTNSIQLKKLIDSFRDWGRDCFCQTGKDNTCNRRFSQQFGQLPYGYDHKYVYSHLGYNLKATEMQAAIGCAQLDKLSFFIQARKRNWKILRDGLEKFSDIFVLPEATENSDPSWFAFLLTVRSSAKFSRNDIVNYLELKGVQTRMLFAGNLLKHPCFDEMRQNKKGYRVIGDLKNTDIIMESSFCIGVYPGMTDDMLCYIIDCFKKYCN